MRYDGIYKRKKGDDYFVYNGRASTEFGIYARHNETFASPERDITTVEVPGRNGTLTIDNKRFHNVDIVYSSAWITQDFTRNFEAFKNFMLKSPGYHRLEDTYHPDYYRKARFTGPLDPDAFLDRAGGFDIHFDCDPRCFLKEGDAELPMAYNYEIINPTEYEAKPLLFLDMQGMNNVIHSIRINDDDAHDIVITADCPTDKIYIDFETENAYGINDENLNMFVFCRGYDYPTLKPGLNTIKMVLNPVNNFGWIKPRWYKI